MQDAECGMRNATQHSFALALLCLLLTALCIGCNVGGVVAAKVLGPPDVPAKYVPAETPILVLAESYRRPGLSYDAEQLARHVVEQIDQWQIAPTIDLMSLHRLRDSRGPAYAKMTIPEIGRTLGAAQVLYIDVIDAQFEQTGGTEVHQGQMAVRVRLVDCVDGSTLWPADAEGGYPVAYEPRFEGFSGDTNPNTVRQKTHAGLAWLIVRNFRKWKPDNLQEEEMERM